MKNVKGYITELFDSLDEALKQDIFIIDIALKPIVAMYHNLNTDEKDCYLNNVLRVYNKNIGIEGLTELTQYAFNKITENYSK